MKYPRFNDNLLQCPICNGNWDGGDIAEYLFNRGDNITIEEAEKDAAKYYGWSKDNRLRFRKVIGIEIQGEYDGVSFWQCPHCRSEWNRFTNLLTSHRGKEL
jgi:Zn-finger nucleic acid-binding protein